MRAAWCNENGMVHRAALMSHAPYGPSLCLPAAHTPNAHTPNRPPIHPFYPHRPRRSSYSIPGTSITAFCIMRAGPIQNMRYCVLSTRKTTSPSPIGRVAANALPASRRRFSCEA